MRMLTFLPFLLLLLASARSHPREPSAPEVPARERKPEKMPRTDRYGDPLPAGAIARMGTTRLRSLAMSPDGKTVAAADEATICLWEARTGRLLHRFSGRNAPFPTVLFSKDSTMLVALENVRP